MWALVYDDATKQVTVDKDWPKPEPGPGEALIRVRRAAVCSTDLEITKGYVPGFRQPLGHEFVGVVSSCGSRPDLVGRRVVGEINCNCAGFTCADAIFQRNHAPGRTVLGIINKDGCMAQYLTLPAVNLHVVPDSLSDAEAAFCEPLAAACRIVEQGLVERGPGAEQRVAVLGDGKLGLLVAQVLALEAPGRVSLFGRHEANMALVSGLKEWEVAGASLATDREGQFDLVVEATGSSGGISAALSLTRPMGTLVLKSTVSLKDPSQPQWAAIANDIVVNEKTLVGSRCGPVDAALSAMERHPEVRKLLAGMLHKELPMAAAGGAIEAARGRGVLKVQIVFPGQEHPELEEL